VLLDLGLPGLDGVSALRRLRKGEQPIPVIIITARVEEADKIAGLDIGADDYVTKPFSIHELVARVHAVLRRARTSLDQPQMLVRGELTVDESGRRVTVGEREIPLTRKEFGLLAELARRPGRVWTREQLLERVWGYNHPGATRTVDVHVRQLRKKLGEPMDASIETVVGVGYRFRVES